MLRIVGTAAAVLLAGGVAAHASTITFNEFNEGDDLVGPFNFGSGLTGTISVTGPNSGQALICDTMANTSCTDNDPDLEELFTNIDDSNDERAFGNALILQNDEVNPVNDDPDGGTITFTFDQPINLEGLIYLDGEEGAFVTVGGSQVGGVAAGADNHFDILDLSGEAGAQNITEFTVVYNGSGAIGEIHASVVPLPAPILLLLSAIGGLSILGYRGRGAV